MLFHRQKNITSNCFLEVSLAENSKFTVEHYSCSKQTSEPSGRMCELVIGEDYGDLVHFFSI